MSSENTRDSSTITSRTGIWSKPYIEVPRSRFPSVDILAQEVSRAPERHPRHALFLGAGASRSSGIDTADNLIDRWRKQFFADRCRPKSAEDSEKYKIAYEKWLTSQYEEQAREWEQHHGRHPSEYAFLFSFIASCPFARQETVERLVEDKEPGPGYIYLACLVLEGRFRTILTTNFDDLIHDALFRYAGLKPAVCAFDSQISSIHPNMARPIIVKLHGDFMYKNMRNVGPEVQSLSLNMREKLHQTCKGNGLIVLGYGGCDESVMTPLSGMLHDGTFLEDGLHWCLHYEKNQRDMLMVPGEVWRLYDSHRERVKLYWTDGFDDAMEKIYCACDCKPPKELVNPRENSLIQRLTRALKKTDWSHKVSGHFNQMLNDFLAKESDDRPAYIRDLQSANFHFLKAKAFQKANRFDVAEEELRKSIGYCDKVLNKHSAAPGSMPDAEVVPDAAAVAAYRRRSGAVGQWVEVHLLMREMECAKTEDLEVDSILKSTVGDLATDSLDNATAGLRLAEKCAESADDVKALTYNALVAYGYRRLVLATPLPETLLVDFKKLRLELEKLDTDKSDMKELRNDCHGYWLIERDIDTPHERPTETIVSSASQGSRKLKNVRSKQR